MSYIDFRSDTVTQPTDAMREAIYRAPVGDDVFSDDPTVCALEVLAAQRLGKEAALFVASGTQGNAVALLSHTRRGDAIVLTEGCHIADHEAGSYGMLASVSPRFAKSENGVYDLDSVRALIADDSDLQVARTGLICMENAHSLGTVVPLENMQEVYKLAQERGVPVHLDGARLFNAAAVLEVDAKEMTACCDSVMCCLSKGLCAPVGSVVAGTQDFINRARKARKILGGGMRQAGILAAAGILALTEMTGRLVEDHENAKLLAAGLAQIPGVAVNTARAGINMIFFTVDWSEQDKSDYPQKMLEAGYKVTGYTDGAFRLVTNRDVTGADCDGLVQAIARWRA